MSASLTIIGPMRLPVAVSELMPKETASARAAVVQRIERMDKVFHLIEEPEMRGWLTGALPRGVEVEDLSPFYFSSGPNLGELHLEVAEWVMQGPRLGFETMVVFSGRPELCAPPAAAVNTLALASGIPVAMLAQVFTLPLRG
jgi:hypothetical protein